MNNRLTNKWLHYGMLSFFYATAVATFLVHGVMHAMPGLHSQTPAATTQCQTIGQTIQIIIDRDTFIPANVQAKHCDQLEIVNQDVRPHRPVFGKHHHHDTYPGFQERTLKSGDRSNFVLTKLGRYELHDHFNETSKASIIIE